MMNQRTDRINQLKAQVKTSQAELDHLLDLDTQEQIATYNRLISMDFIDTFTPDHDATSCDDAVVQNGPSFRCNRCALIWAMRTGNFSRIQVRLEVTKRGSEDD